MISQGTLFGTRASQASPWWAVRFWPADLEKGYRWMDLHQSVKVGFIQCDLESLGMFKIFLCLIYLFFCICVCVFKCSSQCVYTFPPTHTYTIYVYANLFMLCGAWHHSAQVGYSKQHPLMHYLTDCQQSLVQQAPGGKKQLYSNLSRFRVTILLIQVHRLPFAYNQQFYCSG